jgi:hypothetical protein
MAGFADSVGLLFKIRADSDDARSELDKFSKDVKKQSDDISSSGENAFNRLAKSVGLSAEQTTALSTALPIAGAAIAGVAAIATGAAVGLFALTKSSAEYGGAIKDAQEKTGLGAQTLSTLRYAAEQGNQSFETLSGGITKFTKLIGEAAEGSQEAKEKLKRLGIDPQAAIKDLDGALKKVFDRIYALPPGVAQTKAAIDAFGKSGAELIVTVNALGGDFEKFKQQAKELGVVLSDADTKAADEFSDTLVQLKAQASGVAFQFTKGLMPAVTGAMREISRYVTANQETIRRWGESIGKYVSDTVKEFKKTDGTWQEAGALLGRKFVTGFAQIVNKGINDAIKEAGDQSRAEILRLLGRKEIGASNITEAGSDTVVLPKYDRGGAENRKPSPTGIGDESYLTNNKAIEDAKQAAEKAAQEREAIANRNISALISSWEMYAGDINKIFNNSYKSVKEIFEKTGDKDSFKRNLDGLIDYYIENIGKTDAAIANLENQQATREKKTAAERDLLQRQQNERTQKFADKYIAAQVESEKIVNESARKSIEARTQLSEADAARQIELNGVVTATKLSNLELSFKTSGQLERDYLKESDNLKYQSLKYQETVYKALLNNTALSPEKRAEIVQTLRLIAEQIKQSFNEVTIRNVESFSKALETVGDIFADLGLSVGDTGLQTGLQRLNKLLADPEITEALRKRAEALGWTVEQMKEMLRVQQESADNGLTTGGRERVVNEGEKEKPDLFLGESVLTSIDDAGNRVTKLSNIFGELKNIAGDSLRSLAQGLGSVVQNFVLLGNTGGQSMQKLVASVLASVSAQAATIAVMELAYGIAALTPWGAAIYGPATLHFQAAALMGSIALGSGVAGRLTAGNSFSQGSAAGAFKSQTSSGAISTGQGRTGSSNGGTAYGGDGSVRDIQESRMARSSTVTHKHEIKLTMDKGVIVQEVSENVNSFGVLHGLIIKTADA